MSFDHPRAFWLSIPLALLALVLVQVHLWQRAAHQVLGQVQGVRPVIWYRPVLLMMGMTSLIFAAAGPRWGKGQQNASMLGRDLVIVFDFSWSMTAEDMNHAEYKERWDAAMEGVLKLVQHIKSRGGERLGFVVFAARPYVVCPLTADYDHFINRLIEYTPHAPPPEIRPAPTEDIDSGSRIGWGIGAALELFDREEVGYHDILLISDGDGPGVEADVEPAIRACLDLQVPCHVCGVGNSKMATPLTIGRGEDLEFVTTKLQEEFLRSVARRTQGEYIAAHQDIPELDQFYEQTLKDRKKRELPADSVPLPANRTVWFILLGLGLIFSVWWRG